MVDRATDRRGPADTLKAAALWVVAAFVFSIPYENGVSVPGVGSLARLVGIAAIAVTIVSLFKEGRLRMRVPSLFLLMAAAYLVWSAASYLWSIDPPRTLGRVTSLAQLVAMAWMIHQVAVTQKQRDVLAQAFVFGAYAAVMLALAVRVLSPETAYRDVGGMNPNWFSIGCALAIPVAWGLALRVRNRALFWVYALYPAFALIVVVLAASRGGLITALVALSVIPLTMPRLTYARRAMIVAVLVLFAGGVAALGPQSFPELAPNIDRLLRAPEELAGGTLTGRTTIWEHGFDAFYDAPIAGYGSGTFSRVVAEGLGRPRGAHNGYLSVIVSVGLIGLALYVGMMIVAGVSGALEPQRRLELLVLLATVAVALMPANIEHTKSVWFVLSLVAVSRPVLIATEARNGRVADVQTHHSRPLTQVVDVG